MEISTDKERKAKQHRMGIAIVVGLFVMLCAGAIIASNPSSWINWVSALALFVAGGVLEEKFLSRRK